MVYVASRKAAALLGLHPQTLRRYADQGNIPHYRNSAGQRLYDVDAYLRGASRPNIICYCRVSSAKQRGDLGRQVAQMRELYPDAESRHRRGRWSQLATPRTALHTGTTASRAISSTLWLPTGTDWPGSDLNSSSGWSYRTAAQSWFSTSRMPAPNPNSPRIYSPSSIRSVAGCTDSGATERQSRRIRVYPNARQKVQIVTWLDASRWTYNLTVEILQSGIPAVWRHIAGMVMAELKVLKPEWAVGTVPGETDCGAGRLPGDGQRQDLQPAAGSGSSHRPTVGRTIRTTAVPQSEELPSIVLHTGRRGHGARRLSHHLWDRCGWLRPFRRGKRNAGLVKERGLYWLVVPHPAQCDIETPSGDGVVALDPGVRTFLTYFSETDCGKIGHRAFGRIQRFCHWLDDLISRTDNEPDYQRRRRMRRAQARITPAHSSTWWTNCTGRPLVGSPTITKSSCCRPLKRRTWPAAPVGGYGARPRV